VGGGAYQARARGKDTKHDALRGAPNARRARCPLYQSSHGASVRLPLDPSLLYSDGAKDSGEPEDALRCGTSGVVWNREISVASLPPLLRLPSSSARGPRSRSCATLRLWYVAACWLISLGRRETNM